MTTHWPRHIYREDVQRRAWWLHIILVVVWGWNVVVGGWVEFWHSWETNPESPYKRVKIPSCASAGLLFCRYWHLLAMSGVPKEEARICLQLATSFAHTHGNSMV